MNTRRTATTAATALAALTTGGLLLAFAATASAQDRPDRSTAPVPGMAQMHQQMTEQDPGMARMHQLVTDGPR